MAESAYMTQYAGRKSFERSSSDKERKGEKEGSSKDNTRDAKQRKRLTIAEKGRYYRK